jgi:hypothetical protein
MILKDISMRFPAISGETREAEQQVFRVAAARRWDG